MWQAIMLCAMAVFALFWIGDMVTSIVRSWPPDLAIDPEAVVWIMIVVLFIGWMSVRLWSDRSDGGGN